MPKSHKAIFRRELGRRMEAAGVPLLGVLPFDDLLNAVRLDEIQAELGAHVFTGASLVDAVVDQVPSRRTPLGILPSAVFPMPWPARACTSMLNLE